MIARARTEPEVRGDLLNRYRGYLLVVAERSLDSLYQSRIDAEDMVQNTMMRAERSFGQFQGTNSRQFFQWLMTIHRNCLRSELSRQSAAKRDPTRESAIVGPTDGMAVVFWTEPSDGAVTPSVRTHPTRAERYPIVCTGATRTFTLRSRWTRVHLAIGWRRRKLIDLLAVRK